MGREYFCAYHSYLDSMRNLSDEECGRLFRALLQYSATGEAPALPDRESIAFDFMRSQVDRDRAAYERKREKMRENGMKAIAGNWWQLPPEATQGKGEGEEEGKGKGKGKTRRNNLSIISSSNGAAGAEEIEMMRRLE